MITGFYKQVKNNILLLMKIKNYNLSIFEADFSPLCIAGLVFIYTSQTGI